VTTAVRDRLHAAGLYLPLPPGDPADHPTLLGLFGVRALVGPSASRPGRITVDSDRISALLDAVGLGGALPVDGDHAALLLRLPLPTGVSATSLLQAAMGSSGVDREELLAMARQLDEPAVAQLFLDGLQDDDDDVAIESMLGVVRWNAREHAQLLLPSLADDSAERAIHALYTLQRLQMLEPMASEGQLDRWLEGEHGDKIQVLVDFALEGDPGALADLLSEADWSERVALHRLVRAVAEQQPGPELFEVLLRHGNDESDSDSAVAWSWALAAAAPADAYDLAEALVDLAESLSEGGYAQCAALVACGRLQLLPDQRAELTERLLAITISDSDTQAAIRMAVGRLQPEALCRAPGSDDRLLAPGYSRLEDFFGAWGGEAAPSQEAAQPPIPSPAVAAFLQPERPEAARPLVAALRRDEASLSFMNLLAACLVTWHPQAVPLLDALVQDKGKPTDMRRAAAGALLTWPQPLATPPAMLRCLVGGAVGGPLPDDPHSFGQLLGLLEDGDCEEAAANLMAAAKAEYRAVGAGYFDARMASDPSSRKDNGKHRARMGVPLRPLPPHQVHDPLMALAAGLAVRSSAWIEVLRADRAAGVVALRDYLRELREREQQLAVARDPRLLAELPDDALMELWLALAHSGHWLPRECAANMARVAGERLVAHARGGEVAERLLELKDDDDSDVSSVSTEVCERLELD